MEHLSTMKQLKCSGIVAAALMSRSTYPSKLFHSEVVKRYRMLNKGNDKLVHPDVKTECEDICKKMLKHFETTNKFGKTVSGFEIGNTRAYFRSGGLDYLELERLKILVETWVLCSAMGHV